MSVKAIILAAGTASRLRPLTSDRPKCLLKIGERTLLERSMDALIAAGVSEFCIVTGYLHNLIEDFVSNRYPGLKVTFIHNEVYDSTNNIYSLYLARPVAEGSEVLLLDSDLVYDPEIARLVVAAPDDNVLTLIRHDLGEEEMKVVTDAQGQITEISKTCSPAQAAGESLGIEKMGPAYTRALYKELEVMMNERRLSITLLGEKVPPSSSPKKQIYLSWLLWDDISRSIAVWRSVVGVSHVRPSWRIGSLALVATHIVSIS